MKSVTAAKVYSVMDDITFVYNVPGFDPQHRKGCLAVLDALRAQHRYNIFTMGDEYLDSARPWQAEFQTAVAKDDIDSAVRSLLSWLLHSLAFDELPGAKLSPIVYDLGSSVPTYQTKKSSIATLMNSPLEVKYYRLLNGELMPFSDFTRMARGCKSFLQATGTTDMASYMASVCRDLAAHMPQKMMG